MNWKVVREFWKPTWKKLIMPLISIIVLILFFSNFWDFFIYYPNETKGLFQAILLSLVFFPLYFLAIGSFGEFVYFLGVLLIPVIWYYFSCYLMSKNKINKGFFGFLIALISLHFLLSSTFIARPSRQSIQGIEVVDAYCVEGSTDIAILMVRNIGTRNISVSGIQIIRTNPEPTRPLKTIDIIWSGETNLAPGKVGNASVPCPGSGGRPCNYRLTPPTGRTITGAVYCT